MRLLRTLSTRRLLASIVGVLAACLGCTAIALAASGGGSVPPPATLAEAIHGALTGSPVNGVSANITFTDNLFTGSSIETQDPLITGASGRLWASPGHMRIELQTDNGDAEVVLSGHRFWAYDPTSNTAYEGDLPARGAAGTASSEPSSTAGSTPSVAQIRTALTDLSANANVSTATPTDIGGQPAYSVTISPKSGAGLLGSVRLGFDSGHAVPLDFALIPRGSSSPALELAATGVSYGAVPASVFQISPPAGAHVVKIGMPGDSGWRSYAPNAGSAYAPNAGPGSVHVVGHGLGAVIVAQHPAGGSAGHGSGPAGPLSLQHVRIDGAGGRQLSTSLGTVLEFTRNGVGYLLAGSVTPATIDAVARGL